MQQPSQLQLRHVGHSRNSNGNPCPTTIAVTLRAMH